MLQAWLGKSSNLSSQTKFQKSGGELLWRGFKVSVMKILALKLRKEFEVKEISNSPE